MAFEQKISVAETSTTTGTGAYALGGALSGRRAFSAHADGATVCCRITMGTDWEFGLYTFSSGANTLTRTAVIKSTNSDNAVNWGAGTKTIREVSPAFSESSDAIKIGIGDLLTNVAEVTVASASTCDILGAASNKIAISGTTTITSFGTGANRIRFVRFTGALTLTHNGTSLILPGAANITTVAGDTCIVVADGSSNCRVLAYQRGASLPAGAGANADITSMSKYSPRGHIAGLALSNNGTDATNDIDIAAGSCRDSTNAATIACAAMTKQLDAGWAAGSAAGMRNSAASITDTTYHIYAVAKADGTQDYYAHTSTTVATVITALQAETGGSAYIYARRIGSIIRESSAIVAFVHDGDKFMRSVSISAVADAPPSTTNAVTTTLKVPVGIRIEAIVAAWCLTNNASGSAVYFLLTDLSQADTTPASGAFSLAVIGTATAFVGTAGDFRVMTNTSAQIRRRISATANMQVFINTLGWVDRRGRDA